MLDILRIGVYNYRQRYVEKAYMEGRHKMKRQELINARGNKTQTEVAEALGISQKYLSKIELGQRTPSATLLASFH